MDAKDARKPIWQLRERADLAPGRRSAGYCVMGLWVLFPIVTILGFAIAATNTVDYGPAVAIAGVCLGGLAAVAGIALWIHDRRGLNQNWLQSIGWSLVDVLRAVFRLVVEWI